MLKAGRPEGRKAGGSDGRRFAVGASRRGGERVSARLRSSSFGEVTP